MCVRFSWNLYVNTQLAQYGLEHFHSIFCSPGNSRPKRQSGSLSQTGSLSVTISSFNYAVAIGNSVTLNCTVTGTATSVTWQRIFTSTNSSAITVDNSKYVGGSLSSPPLTINNATLTDEGTYRCSANNSNFNRFADTFVDVVGSE